MGKTKHIKVAISERLPNPDQNCFVISYDGDESTASLVDFEYYEVEYWLEEVPDREEEMKEDLIRNLKKAVEALELIGSITGEEMPLTIEDAKRMINKYS